MEKMTEIEYLGFCIALTVLELPGSGCGHLLYHVLCDIQGRRTPHTSGVRNLCKLTCSFDELTGRIALPVHD